MDQVYTNRAKRGLFEKWGGKRNGFGENIQ
jgi:hypothetical protein